MVLEIIGATLITIVIIIYTGYIFSKPLGGFIVGNDSESAPLNRKLTAAVKIVIYTMGMVILLQSVGILSNLISDPVKIIACYIYAIYVTLCVVKNLLSKNKKEHWFLILISALVAVFLWFMALVLSGVID